jgi:hypothetical protein
MKRYVVVNGGRGQKAYFLLDLEKRCVVFKSDSETAVIAMARRREANEQQRLARPT